ncbi:MAG: ribonuclease Z [Thermodesulfobacteriota bacterium]
MRHSFQPRLINEPFSDPGLFIRFLFERRALLFDLGDLGNLSARDLLKVSHVFVTHTHIDHFIGFDQLLRVLLAREKEIQVFGPPGFFVNVEGKLAGYTWNLVDEFPLGLAVKATEVHPDRTVTKTYLCEDRFRPQTDQQEAPFEGVLLREPSFRIEGCLLDHRTPCLGLSMVEEVYVNINREALSEMELPVGPWLTRFKKSLLENKDPGQDFSVTWEAGGGVVKERKFALGDLADRISKRSPGQKIAYITDVLGSPENLDKMVRLAWKSDHLFVEAGFLESDREIAREKFHLTAREAGELARRAEVKEFTLFHFSPRYQHREEELRKEALAAFAG